jgi:hypothetical protein
VSLTAERLRELLEYSPETGVFTWKVRSSNRIHIGDEAGSKKQRYVYILIDGKLRLAHRLAWLYVHGEWPNQDIDHINRNGRDNRIANLRLATMSDNQCNAKTRTDNSTGFRGVFPKRSKFAAQIRKGSIRWHLGVFDTPEQAHAAYCEAARKLHGAFAYRGG